MSNAFDSSKGSKGKQAGTAERRDAQRYPFVCPAELIDITGNTMISARTSDLSLHGCYVDTLNPLPVGSRVRLQLTKNNQRLEFRALVTACHVGGMGLVFEQLTTAQQDTVVSWLEGTSAPGYGSFRGASPPTVPASNPKKKTRFAVRLVQILERRGILAHSEAEDLLRDLDS